MSKMINLAGTLTFPSLFTPDRFDKYSATVLLPKGGDEHKKLTAAIAEVAKELPSKPTAVCMKDGDTSSYDGFAGNVSVGASRKTPFAPHQLVDHSKQPITADGVFYPGCQVNFVVSIWAQNNTWGKKVNAELVAIQLTGHGDRLKVGEVADIDDDTFAELPPLEDATSPEDFM